MSLANSDVNININTKANLKGIEDAEKAYSRLLSKMKTASMSQIMSGKVEQGAGFESFGKTGGKSSSSTINELMEAQKAENDVKQRSLTLQQNQSNANINNLESSRKQYGQNAAALDNLEGEFKAQESATGKFRKNALMFGLSVMFAGMALQKATEGFLQPAMDAVGIMDIFSAALLILFLPAVIALLPWALKFLDFVVGLDDNIKLLIGGAVIFLMLLGSLMLVFGSLSAFYSGVSLLTPLLKGVTAAIGGAGTTGSLVAGLGILLAAIALIIAALVILEGKKTWDEKGGPGGEISQEAPFIYEGVTGSSAIAQQIPIIGGPAGWIIEGWGGVIYDLGDELFGDDGIFHDAIVDSLANNNGGDMQQAYANALIESITGDSNSTVDNSNNTNIGQQVIYKQGSQADSIEDLQAKMALLTN